NVLTFGFAFIFGSHRHTQGSGNRSRTMAHAKSIVYAFASFREAGNTAVQPVGMKNFLSACQYLMPVSLMANVPYELIQRRVENIVQGYRQFNYTETRAEMASVD